jgi:hypothetical protein
MRYRTLLDFCSKSPLNWINRMKFYYTDKFEKQRKSTKVNYYN